MFPEMMPYLSIQMEEPKARKAQPEVPSWVKQPKPYPEKPEDEMVSAVAILKEEPLIVATQEINEISTTHAELALYSSTTVRELLRLWCDVLLSVSDSRRS